MIGFEYTEDPWVARHPKLPNIFANVDDEKPCTPMHNLIVNNTFCGVRQMVEVFDDVDASKTIEGNDKSADCPDDDL